MDDWLVAPRRRRAPAGASHHRRRRGAASATTAHAIQPSAAGRPTTRRHAASRPPRAPGRQRPQRRPGPAAPSGEQRRSDRDQQDVLDHVAREGRGPRRTSRARRARRPAPPCRRRSDRACRPTHDPAEPRGPPQPLTARARRRSAGTVIVSEQRPDQTAASRGTARTRPRTRSAAARPPRCSSPNQPRNRAIGRSARRPRRRPAWRPRDQRRRTTRWPTTVSRPVTTVTSMHHPVTPGCVASELAGGRHDGEVHHPPADPGDDGVPQSEPRAGRRASRGPSVIASRPTGRATRTRTIHTASTQCQ